MNRKRIALLLTLSLIVVLALTAALLAYAQEPEQEDETAAEVEGAAVGSVVPIQGYLTDASGNPLNGNHSVTASIYDVSAGGTALCFDLDNVTVHNGLFNMNMDYCSASDIDGDQLYLGVQVGADPEMTPRQAIYPVPYAWTVKPGAIIRGANSYLFVPGNAFIKNASSDTTIWGSSGGTANILPGTSVGNKYIRIPITIPSVLYGEPVRVTGIRVYYKCDDGADNYITETRLYKHTDTDSWVYLVNDATNRQSNTATSYYLSTDSANNTLSSTQGILSVRLYLRFVNNADDVRIGGVRLTLEHTP